MKVTITKQPGNSESIQVETEWDGTSTAWARDVEPILARLDKRMHEMNLRILRGAQQSRAIDENAARVVGDILRMVNGIDLETAKASLEAAGVPI